MTTVRTSLGWGENARKWRFEPTLGITQTNVQKAIEQVKTTPPSIVTTAVAVGASPYTVLTTDTVLFVDSSGGPVTINLGLASARGGVPITIKDIAGSAATNAITITPNVGDTGGIDGLATLPISANYGGFRLLPGTSRYAIDP